MFLHLQESYLASLDPFKLRPKDIKQDTLTENGSSFTYVTLFIFALLIVPTC